MTVSKASIGSRLGTIRRALGLSVIEFSSATGVSVSTLKKYESDNSTPGGKAIQSIVKPGINAHWLLTGEGEPLTDGEGLIEIPELDVSFSAGPGSYPADHVLAIGRRPFSREWVRKKGLKPEHLALTRVCGDSMEPLLKDKDMVMLDQSVNSPVTAMPLAFRLDNELYIKLCQADGRGNLAMISVNKIYDPILIEHVNPPPDFCIIAAVVWHAHSWI